MLNAIDFATTCRWTKRNLTFAFDTGTADTAGEFTAVRNAFKTWAAIVPLTFTEVATNQAPDFFVDWRPANDPDHSMVGTVFAHADFPPGCSVITNTLPKPLHFDDSGHRGRSARWRMRSTLRPWRSPRSDTSSGWRTQNVAGSVMFPTVSDNFTKRSLTAGRHRRASESLSPHHGQLAVVSRNVRGCSSTVMRRRGAARRAARTRHGQRGNYSPAHNQRKQAPSWRTGLALLVLEVRGDVLRWNEGGRRMGKRSSHSTRSPAAATTVASRDSNVAPGQQRGWR